MKTEWTNREVSTLAHELRWRAYEQAYEKASTQPAVDDSKDDLVTQLAKASKKFSEKYPGLTAEPSKQDRIDYHIKKANKHFRKAHEHFEELLKIVREVEQ